MRGTCKASTFEPGMADQDLAVLRDKQKKLMPLIAEKTAELTPLFDQLVALEGQRAPADTGTNYASMTGLSVTVGGIVAILDSAYEQSAAFKSLLKNAA